MLTILIKLNHVRSGQFVINLHSPTIVFFPLFVIPSDTLSYNVSYNYAVCSIG